MTERQTADSVSPAAGGVWSEDHRESRAAIGRRLDIYGSFQAVMGQFTGGVFLTGYALALHADAPLIGLLAALPLGVKLTQLYTSWHIERAGHWRSLAMRSAVISRILFVAAAMIPFVLPSNIGQAWALVIVVGLSSFAGSIFDLAFLTWMAELIPASVRGAFLGERSRVTGLVGQGVALLAAFGLDRWRSAQSGPGGFSLLFVLAAVIGLSGLLFLRRVPTPRRSQSRVVGEPVMKSLAVPARDRNFRWLLIFIALWHFSVGLVGPFVTVLMLRELALPFVVVTAFSVLTNVIMSLAQSYWGRLGDHFGSKTALRAGTYLITSTMLVWLAVTPERIWPIVVVQLLSGFGWAAYHANLNNLVLKLAPGARRPSYIASLGAVSGVAEATGPIVGGVILAGVRTLGVHVLAPYYILFVVSFVLRAVATALPGYVHEPGGVPVGRMMRVMARFRSMNTAEPFEPIFSYAYTHVARIADFIARERPVAPIEHGSEGRR
jgi:MFS family permease